jgi:hypothetical protein
VKRTIIVEVTKQNQETPVDKVNLTVKIGPNPANLTVEVDGLKQFEGVLLPGSEKKFHAANTIRIHTKNAGSTTVIFNSVKTVLGNENQEVEKTFP